MLLFPARVSPWSGRPQGEARGTGGFHQPCTEGKPTARVREHYDSQPGCSLLETHHFSGGRGKMLESPNSRDICLLTKVCISAFLTLGSCFHYYFFFFFFFSQSKEGENLLAVCQVNAELQAPSQFSPHQDSAHSLIILLFMTAAV